MKAFMFGKELTEEFIDRNLAEPEAPQSRSVNPLLGDGRTCRQKKAVRMYSSRVEKQGFVDRKSDMKVYYKYIGYGFFEMDDGSKMKLAVMNGFGEIKHDTESGAKESLKICRASFA